MSKQDAAPAKASLSRMIRKRELPQFTGLQRSQIDEMIKRKEFPAPAKASDTGRANIWFEDELVGWQQARRAKRDAGTRSK